MLSKLDAACPTINIAGMYCAGSNAVVANHVVLTPQVVGNGAAVACTDADMRVAGQITSSYISAKKSHDLGVGRGKTPVTASTVPAVNHKNFTEHFSLRVYMVTAEATLGCHCC